MAYDENGQWVDDENPYQYADWTDPNTGDQHTYQPPQEPAWDPRNPIPTTGPGSAGAPGVAFYGNGPGQDVLGNLNQYGIPYQILQQTAGPGGPLPPGAPPGPSLPGGPRPGGSGGGGGSYGGGGGSFGGFPQFHMPALPTIAPLQRPAPFSFDSYRAPSLEEAQNEPGYAFAMDQGRKALENSAAAKGVLRTGGTLKDILNWGQRSGEQNYGNVYNRSVNTYSLNRNNAADAYKTNWGVDTDTFDRNTDLSFGSWDRELQGKLAEFNPNFRASELQFDDLYRRWKAGLDSTTAIATAGAGV